MYPHDTGRLPRSTLALLLLAIIAGCGSRTGLLEIGSESPAQSDASLPPPSRADAGPPSLVLFGGMDETGALLGDTWRWDGTEWTPLTPSSAPSPRAQATLTPLGDTLVLVGGNVAASDAGTFPVSADTWIWQGQSWSQASPLVSPDARYGSAASAFGGGVVRLGGWKLVPPMTASSATWTWDGTSWSAANDLASSYEPAAATLNGVLVAFGGETDDAPTNVTSMWTGSTWATLKPAHSPPARRGASMAVLGNTLVLFGGDVIGVETWESVNDTWVWDGTDWTQATPVTSPPARSNAAMATLSGVVVMAGGADFETPVYADTWEWDGTQWTERKVTGPGARWGAVMAGE